MKPTVKTIASQPSWVIRNKQVELAVTRLGGHIAPVTFCRDTARPVQPYYISPWQNEGLKIDEPVLVPLRGDFFCAPFGDNADAYRGERHCVHGEPAGARWRLARAMKGGGVTQLVLKMATKVRPGTVTKTLSLVDGHNGVYQQDLMAGFSGSMPVGHHAILAVPDAPGALRVSTSAFRFGMTNPGWFSDPADRNYQSLDLGLTFTSLARVPTLWKRPAFADLTRFPERLGYEDLAAVFHKPGRNPAWTAAVNTEAGYLWFALKDACVLPALAMWISNQGRQGPPWEGRNRCLGLEDVCGYFAEGLAASARPNPLNRAGIPTAIKLSPKTPTAVNYIQGAIRIPRGFDQVRGVRFLPGKVRFTSRSGKSVTAPVNHAFLKTGRI